MTSDDLYATVDGLRASAMRCSIPEPWIPL